MSIVIFQEVFFFSLGPKKMQVTYSYKQKKKKSDKPVISQGAVICGTNIRVFHRCKWC